MAKNPGNQPNSWELTRTYINVSRKTSTADRRWVTLREAGEHLGVSYSTIRRMRDRGELRTYRVSERCLRVDLAELDRCARRVKAVGDN